MSVGSGDHAPLLLPPGTRLLHIGPPKTGTTALQHGLQRARSVLYEHGVLYPGTGVNHYREVYAFMGRRGAGGTLAPPWSGRWPAQVPPMSEWAALKREIAAEPDRRVVISHEAMARSSARMARAFVREFGAKHTHIAITLRPPAELLPSRWSEQIKEGSSADTFDQWLRRLYGRTRPPLSQAMLRYLDQGALVERWAGVVGPQRVTVIIADRRDRRLLADAFEGLLGLPPRTLDVDGAASAVNRSMTAPEADVIRILNARIGGAGSSAWRRYFQSIRTDLIDRALARRTPGPAEPRLRLPEWAAPLTADEGRRYAERILASGVRVVGDLGPYFAVPAAADRVPEPAGAGRPGMLTGPLVAGGLLIGAARGVTGGAARMALRRIHDRAGGRLPAGMA